MYNRCGDKAEEATQAQLARDELVALAEAVHALRQLGSHEARKKLEEYEAFLEGSQTSALHVKYSGKLLNSFCPDFWVIIKLTKKTMAGK